LLPDLPRTISDAFDLAAIRDGDRDAYVDGVRRLTFGEWGRATDSLAAALASRGVEPGDVVAIRLPSTIDYAICFGAILKVGAIATGINLRLGPDEVNGIVELCQPALVIEDSAVLPHFLPGYTAVLDRSELGALYDRELAGWVRPQREPSDPAVIIWTSGTSGLPKGAWFDHENLAAAVASAGVMTARHDRRLIATPFSHAGYMAKLWEQLATGSTIVISPVPWRATDTSRLLVEERITMLGAVPTQWAKLVDLPEIAAADLSALRIGVCATAPAPPELVERVRERIGCPLIVRYAMTESPSITGTDPDDPPEVQFRTVGRAQSGVEIEIVGDDGRPVASGEVGRVRVRGATVMRGYWLRPEQTREVLSADGWLTSGDLGRLTPDGNLVLVGRASDMYIRGGYNVHPLEVENVLSEHTGVDRASVVGIAADVIGEIGVAFVVPSDPDRPPSLAELREFVASRLADYKAPDRLELVDDLPLTAMLKVDKAMLRSQAMADHD
jgi:acyl-CoA synthetase (AMP-forming)/AMP-acid ligase II